jgi:hypothetical protein
MTGIQLKFVALRNILNVAATTVSYISRNFSSLLLINKSEVRSRSRPEQTS